MWLDDCRIPFVDEIDIQNSIGGMGSLFGNKEVGKGEKIIPSNKGRFTPNLLVCDDMLNDGNISSQSSGLRKNTGVKTDGWYNNHNDKKPIMTQGDKGTNSRYYNLDLWFDKLLEGL